MTSLPFLRFQMLQAVNDVELQQFAQHITDRPAFVGCTAFDLLPQVGIDAAQGVVSHAPEILPKTGSHVCSGLSRGHLDHLGVAR